MRRTRAGLSTRWLCMYALLICIAEKTNIVVTFFAPGIMRETDGGFLLPILAA